jgi:hypothetical protein
LTANQARGLPGRESVAAALASWRASGGQDSIPALVRARDLAAEKPDGVIVWVHGPQPVLLQPVDALAQAWERRPEGPTLYELSTEPGPNRVIEKLDVLTAVHSVPRFGSLEDDLSRLIRLLQPGGRTFALKREATDTEAQAKAGGAYRTAGHLARLWASSEVSGLRAARKTREAVRLATLYQLVTPVSGAVVLETAAQYAQTGLTPVDPQTVPAIPEPGTLALMVAAVLVLLTWRVRRRANIARS